MEKEAITQKSCLYCGQLFENKSNKHPFQKYCSELCGNRCRRKMRNVADHFYSEKYCLNCGELFFDNTPNKLKQHCSKSCRDRKYRRNYLSKYHLNATVITNNWRKLNPKKVKASNFRNYRTLSGRIKAIKSNAKIRNYDFNLSKEYLKIYWQKPCEFCGCYIETLMIDRICNDKGYVEGNIRSCCQRCNSMKSDLSDEEFLNRIEKIYLNNIKKSEERPNLSSDRKSKN